MSSLGPAESAEADDGGTAGLAEGFGFLLRRHRRAAGLTQEELAARSGLSVRAIRDLERGRARTPQRESVRALSVALRLAGPDAAAFERSARASRAQRAEPPRPWSTELAELPTGVADFTGRDEELSRLRALAELAAAVERRPAGTVVIVAILGQAGIGKTALALRLGQEVAGRFPDANLYVDLRGTDEQPADPAEVLGRFLIALGLPQRLVPAGLEERAARFRALLSRRRALVVLDNAADEAQVRPLLPWGPRCLVLVTSRNVLAGLETRHRLLLDVLTPTDAAALLAEIVGERAVADPAATAEVAELCGNLPLALRIAGNRLASRPAWTVAFLAERLRDARARLQLLQAGDLQVRAAFAMSYAQASPAAQQLFRLLSLVPGADFGRGVAAVLAEIDEAAADAVLEELADASLVLPADLSGRYRFHDLMRLFAGEMLAAEHDEGARQAVQVRLVSWLLQNAGRAGACFLPPGEPRAAEPKRLRAARAAAATWLENERANWTGAFRWAAAHPLPGHPWHLSDTGFFLNWYHSVRGRWTDWREVCASVVEALRGSGRQAEVTLLLCLVDALAHVGREEEALGYAHEALAAAERLGRTRPLAWAMEMTGRTERMLGRFEDSIEHEGRALELFSRDGLPIERAAALDGLGLSLGRSGRFAEAVDRHQQAVEVAREGLDPAYEAIALVSWGETLMLMGEFEAAVDRFQQALTAHVSGGDAWREGVTLRNLGRAYQEMGHFAEAADALGRAATLFAETGDLYDQAGALLALGWVLREDGKVERAAERWRESLEIYSELDLPEATRVRQLLSGQG